MLRPEALRWAGIESGGLALMGWKRHWGAEMGVRPQRRGIEAAEAMLDLWRELRGHVKADEGWQGLNASGR